jgi:hypothetical protein
MNTYYCYQSVQAAKATSTKFLGLQTENQYVQYVLQLNLSNA